MGPWAAQNTRFWLDLSSVSSHLRSGSSMGWSYLDWSSIAAARSDENCKVPILTFVFCICDCVCICTSVSNSRHPPFVRHIHCDISHIDLVIQNIQYVVGVGVGVGVQVRVGVGIEVGVGVGVGV